MSTMILIISTIFGISLYLDSTKTKRAIALAKKEEDEWIKVQAAKAKLLSMEKKNSAKQKAKVNTSHKSSISKNSGTNKRATKFVTPNPKTENSSAPSNLLKPTKTASSKEELLAEKYATSNPAEIMAREFSAKNYTSVLSLYNKISFRDLTDKDRLIYMKALQNLGKTKMLNSFLAGKPINDAEFYLAQGINAYRTGSYRTAQARLKKSLTAPKQFIDYNKLKGEVFYYRAKIASKQFDKSPNKESYKHALEEWRNFGALYSNDRSSSKFKEYRAETRRLGVKFNKNR